MGKRLPSLPYFKRVRAAGRKIGEVYELVVFTVRGILGQVWMSWPNRVRAGAAVPNSSQTSMPVNLQNDSQGF